MTDTLKIDFRVHRVETREVVQGAKILFQGRTNIDELDGSVTYGEWKTNGTASNCIVEPVTEHPVLLYVLIAMFAFQAVVLVVSL